MLTSSLSVLSMIQQRNHCLHDFIYLLLGYHVDFYVKPNLDDMASHLWNRQNVPPMGASLGATAAACLNKLFVTKMHHQCSFLILVQAMIHRPTLF